VKTVIQTSNRKKIIMKAITLSVIVTTILSACLPARASSAYCFDKDTRSYTAVEQLGNIKGATFVRAGYHAGYFVVTPGSSAVATFGLQRAPVIDSDNIARNGVGQDAIAFRFGPDGKLESFPMYISQLSPDSTMTGRLGLLAPEHSTLQEVAELFDGDVVQTEKQGGCTVAYVEVPVYDPNASGS
jgi:hypothetical protein